MPLKFGEIVGVSPGRVFESRQALREAGVHAPPQAGISGNPAEGADSIVVSGGYYDDEDERDFLIYTGQGGNDPNTGRQIADQEFARGNAGLAKSCNEGLPVPVTRGKGGDPRWSPVAGYRYDGLYRVESYWSETGRDGFLIWRFRLVVIDSPPDVLPALPAGQATPKTRLVSQQRVVRWTAVSQAVKEIYKNLCQVCRTEVLVPTGRYAEGAHIRPLGRPHNGPDEPDNVICLCPNCHVRFDAKAFHLRVGESAIHVVDSVTGEVLGELFMCAPHEVSPAHVEYHSRIPSR